MFKLSSKGGETVKGGTYWSYDTGEKITIKGNGVLPGKPSQSYLKFPPAVVPALALILVGVLPGYLSGLYTAFVGALVTAYVVSAILFIVMVLGGLSLMVYRDRSALSRTVKVFRFRPDETVSEADDVAPIKVETSRYDND